MAGSSFSVFAEIKDNRYQVIIDRNPFGLRPIPPPPQPKVEEAPAPPPPDIKLTGITTLLGTPRAMLQVEDKQTKKFSFPTIAQGDTEGAITVLEIDTESMRVRIRNGEAETTLDFKNNGVQPGKGGAVAAVPGVPHPAGAPGVPMGVVPPAPGAAGTPANFAPGRSAIVAGGATAAVTPNPGVNPLAANSYGGLPQRQLRTDSLSIVGGGAGGSQYNPNAPAVPQQQPPISRDEAEARIEAQRRILEQQGSTISRILPPTSMGRAAGQSPPGNSVPTPAPNVPQFPR
jgi:hypothetical protein